MMDVYSHINVNLLSWLQSKSSMYGNNLKCLLLKSKGVTTTELQCKKKEQILKCEIVGQHEHSQKVQKYL